MPLVVVCGQPCSGKSTIVQKLSAAFQEKGLLVEVVDEPSLHLERSSAYTGVVNEKNTRGKLKSTVERVVGRKGVTILDSINNIKGYRYELWCVARAAGTKYCMVHVDTDVDTCRQWNAARPEGERYPPEILDDLACRFERPDPRNRWDAPLFTFRPTQGVGDPGNGDELPEGEVVAAVVGAVSDEPAASAAAARAAKTLTPTMATSNPTLLSTNTLHEIDQAAQDVIHAITEAQAAAAGGAAEVVRFPPQHGLPPLELRQPVTLAELRRHKRSFLKLATKVTFARLSDAAAARRMFVDYLRGNLTGAGGAGAGGLAGPEAWASGVGGDG